ncbi:hypothetical protein BC629DRAFT_630351 [Irpex lacteus]|nr:hypothetical protein BC629DRAFT_630351 [Irpex lacteus]
MTFTTLMGPDCAPMSWGAAVMSLFCGLASITLSFWNANQLRWVTLDNQSILIWMENAKRNASSPWKNASALLAAPSTLCIWSILLYALHLVTSSQCQANPGVDHISLPSRMTWFSTLVEPRIVKTVVVIAAFLLWTYTVHAMRAFAQLTPTLGYLSQV